ncbi:unnamed protein product, partial [marine sediment metagenome]
MKQVYFKKLDPRAQIPEYMTPNSAGMDLSVLLIDDEKWIGGAQTIKTGGDRRAAALGLMVVSHPDIFDFIRAKRVDGILSNFNLSVGVTEEFLDAVEHDTDWDLRFNHKLYSTVKARDIWDNMMDYMIEYGD